MAGKNRKLAFPYYIRFGQSISMDNVSKQIITGQSFVTIQYCERTKKLFAQAIRLSNFV